MRRALAVALALGALALLAGLAGLGHIFAAERAAAERASAERQAALTRLAQAALGAAADTRWQAAAAATRAALTDPLAPAADLLWIDPDGQRLPRRWHPKPGQATPALDLTRVLAPGGPDLGTDDPVWGQRLALRARFFAALDAADPEAQAAAFRALLQHRLLHVLPADHDLPAALTLLEAFTARGSPDLDTLRALIHTGLDDGQGARLPGLQIQLLRRRDAFTAADFAGLAARIAALSRRAGAPVDRFEDEAAAPPAAAIPVPSPLTALTLTPDGWLMAPEDAHHTRGLRLDAASLTAQTTAALRADGHLGPDEAITLDLSAPALAHSLPVTLRSPRPAAAQASARAAYHLKLGLLTLAGLLTLTLLALALTAHRRRQHLLDLKDEFIRTVSHELRTPLTSLRAQAETLERRLAGDPRAKDYPARMIRDVDGLSFLIENILGFNRLSSGRWHPQPIPLSLATLLEDLRAPLTDAVPRPLRWTVTGDATLCLDPTLMALVLSNLARNACHYNARDPITLTWDIRPGPTATELTLTDNGWGIPQAAHRHLFTPFYRAPHPHAVRGSGLGLALCHKILALHGARIHLTRTDPTGTTFTLRFPPG